MLEHYDIFRLALVGYGYSLFRRLFGYEKFVVRQFAVSYERGRFDIPFAELAMTFYKYKAVSRTVLYRYRLTGVNGKSFSAGEFRFIANPFLFMFIVLFIYYRAHKTMLFELGIDVGFPVDNVHKIIEITLFLGRTVFPQQIFGNAMPAE